ncbi:DUF1822 family protein [Nostoc sp. FACHB-110]|uniref:DUF1822 family protein n=1 Tax=Nostoc sp. FACHB-110 TaxID=2692834 RepID=UPI0016898A06|nr:DUF1822 family protein [Nostoc sp. FACHB-110]MBD2438442.1 DUF1822 family protein [Nostoc sp. FACHB-110]
MINTVTSDRSLRLLFPEVVLLEAEDFDWAKNISSHISHEPQQWQNYLDALALIGCERWFQEHLRKQAIYKKFIGNTAYLNVDNFKFCILATEHLLDEVVNIPQDVVLQSELAAHFYLIIEVLEEQEEIIFRGSISYNQLLDFIKNIPANTPRENLYQIPLSKLDAEPNHLLFYCLYSDPAAIPLPVVSVLTQQQNLEKKINLSQWLEHIFDEAWEAIETIIEPDVSLAFSLRNVDKMIRRGKLIDIELQLGSKNLALLVNISKDSEDKLRVLIQLHPTGKQKFLPPNIKLSLLSEVGTLLYEVSARNQDNYIQLKPFKGEQGKYFSIEVSIDNIKIKEDFQL